MTDLANRGPMGLKVESADKDAAYMADIHELPCVICKTWGLPQQSPTQAHHWICGRFSNEKTPDQEAIALCEGHHQGLLDKSKIAIHRQPEEWQRRYGPDTDYIAMTRRMVERIRGNRI